MAFITDKAYDADPLIKSLKNGRSHRIIPSKKRINPRTIPFSLYKKRNTTECFFARLKQFRNITTRYDKLKSMFFAAVQLVSATLELN
ncbi:transposase [Acetobacter estunensis]|uniref:transposase n=1 Tax=Acetobacter estunensis TaxID=104097 RepID=UPI00140B5624